MAKRKALIIYSSMTGNTEMIGKAFGEVCEENGFAVDYLKIKPGIDWDENPVYVEEYDLVGLGSPIIAGLPYKELYEVMGLQSNKWLKGGPKFVQKMHEEMQKDGGKGPQDPPGIPGVVAGCRAPGVQGSFEKTIYGFVFVTYGGCGVGPAEAIGSLEVMEELMRVNNIRTVGKFATCGKEMRHNSVDNLSDLLGVNLDEAQVMLGEYLENPDDPKFAKLTDKQRKALKKLSEIKDEDSFGEAFTMMRGDPMGIGKPGCAMWHYDFEHRPLPRDIVKAKCFMADLVEDYFFTVSGDPRPPYSTYISIS